MNHTLRLWTQRISVSALFLLPLAAPAAGPVGDMSVPWQLLADHYLVASKKTWFGLITLSRSIRTIPSW